MDLASNALTPHRLRKLGTMPASEMAYRGWQEASKWLSRLAPADRAIDPAKWLRSRAPLLADPRAALSMVRDHAPQRFFAGLADPDLSGELFPRDAEAIIAAADAAMNGRFDLLGYQSLMFGDPIDWHLDPVSTRRAPAVHWSLIDPLDPTTVGDSKVIWELNRHQWLIRLAQAWTLTGDPRYAESCVRTIDEWRHANPCGIGINWASSLEVSYRLMSWCWTLMLIRRAPAVTGDWVMSLMVSIWQHANHVRQYLSYYFSPNTHLTGEALGLFYAGTLFPEFRDAPEWHDLGERVLIEESRAQISRDGVHFEQSTYYHGYTAETYLQFILLAQRNRLEIPPAVIERTAQLMEFLIAVRRPDGVMPSIGDSDGGTLLPLVPRATGDRRGLFALAAAMFDRQDFAWAADGRAPELSWLMGVDGVHRFDAIEPAPPASSPSRAFEVGGYAVMRSSWASDAHQLIVDMGPLGCSTSSGHGHADLLAIQCSIFGEPVLVDAGTYCYTPDSAWRQFFRGTTAHSTITIDGAGQAEPGGPFKWQQKPCARLLSWTSDAARDEFEGSHDAYHRLADPVTCRRRIRFEKPRYWMITDELEGAARHQIELVFQFAPGIDIQRARDGWLRAVTPRGRALWIFSRATTELQPSIASGSECPIRGWVSRDYGVREPAPALTYAGAATLPMRIVTLLLPDDSGADAPPLGFDCVDKP